MIIENNRMSRLQISSCQQCKEKHVQITNYLHLIELLKKENQQNNSSKYSYRNTTIPIDSNTYNMFNTIKLILQKRLHRVFNQIKQTPNYKIPLILLNKIVTKYMQKIGFTKLKQSLTQQKGLIKMIEQIFEKRKASCFGKIRNMYGFTNDVTKIKHLKYLLGMVNCKPQQQNIKRLKDTYYHSLKQQISAKSIKELKKQIEHCYRTQSKQNDRKKVSLQMLAEDISQKNQIIRDLQIRIQEYQYNCGENQIINQKIRLKKLLEKANKSYEGVKLDLFKIKQINQRLQQDNKILKEEVKSLGLCVTHLKQQKYNVEIQLQRLIQTNKKNSEFISFWANKSQQLILSSRKNNLQKRRIIKIVKEMNLNSSALTQILNNQTNKQEEEYLQEMINQNAKLQKKVISLISYIDNALIATYEIKQESLYNKQQLDLLRQRKQEVLKKLESLSSVKLLKDKQNDEIETMKIIKVKKNERGDILDERNMILTERNKEEQSQQKDRILQPLDLSKTPSNNRGQKSITMRLLQMQIEKNLQIEKICELKNKFMHIRQIVLRLLQSIDMYSMNNLEMKKDKHRVYSKLFLISLSTLRNRRWISYVSKEKKYSVFYDTIYKINSLKQN